PLPELSVQYADFAAWQRKWLRDETLNGELAYWRQQLSGLESLNLPYRGPTALPDCPADSLPFLASQELLQRLSLLSRSENVTLFMTLIAAFSTLLGRYTGQNQIAIGVPVAHRQHVEIEPLIGFFINLLVLRNDLSGDPTFQELLRRTRTVALGAYAHQDLPFEMLVGDLKPQREMDQPPLVHVTFMLQNTAHKALNLPQLEISTWPVKRREIQFDIMFTMEANTGLVGL